MKFQLKEHHRNTPDDELIEDLKSVAAKLKKRSVTIADYNDNGRFHNTTLTRRLGSWLKILEMAGLEKTRTPLNIPNEDLFRNLEEVWNKLGRQPKYSEMFKPLSQYSAGLYEYRFGTWLKALKAFVDYMNSAGDIPEQHNAVRTKNSCKASRNVNWRLRFIVMRRDGFKCRSCGRSPAVDPTVILHVDHKKAWSNGGETILDNLQTLCSVCNIGKSNLEI